LEDGIASDGFEANDFSDDVKLNSMIRSRSSIIEIDGVRVLDLGSYTVSVDSGVNISDAQSYIEAAQRGWTSSAIASDGTVYATSIRLRLVARRGDFQIAPCTPQICTTGLGAARLGGSKAYFSATQRWSTPIHEFGHMFGLNHQPLYTLSIMSASLNRSVQLADLTKLHNSYSRKSR
jgi:hypothetical protein